MNYDARNHKLKKILQKSTYDFPFIISDLIHTNTTPEQYTLVNIIFYGMFR